MGTKSLQLFGLIALAASALYGQPTNGAQYWSTNPNLDCFSLLGESHPAQITNTSGQVIGYSCYRTGTFLWLAAGGEWGTTIRVAAPWAGAVGVDYTFYDANGNNQNLDTTMNNGSTIVGSNDVNFALYPNQPAEIELLGATGNGPNYPTTATGSVYAVFFCPDQTTCIDVLPQLIYSALPTYPWSLSVPIAWDSSPWYTWSAVGIDDGNTRRVSFAIYNQTNSSSPASFAVRVYNSSGSLVGSGTTPSLRSLQLTDGSYVEGGVYAALLSDVITTPLPAGPFKVVFDGGQAAASVEVLQITGSSATTLQVAYDDPPSSSSTSTSSASVVRRPSARAVQMATKPQPVFKTLAQ